MAGGRVVSAEVVPEGPAKLWWVVLVRTVRFLREREIVELECLIASSCSGMEDFRFFLWKGTDDIAYNEYSELRQSK